MVWHILLIENITQQVTKALAFKMATNKLVGGGGSCKSNTPSNCTVAHSVPMRRKCTRAHANSSGKNIDNSKNSSMTHLGSRHLDASRPRHNLMQLAACYSHLVFMLACMSCQRVCVCKCALTCSNLKRMRTLCACVSSAAEQQEQTQEQPELHGPEQPARRCAS